MLKQAQKELEHLIGSQGLQRFPELQHKILQRTFTISDAEIEHQWIVNWTKKGLLPHTPEKGKWRKFNFVEYVWLKVIKELRDFTVGLETIKRLKEQIMERVEITDHLDKMEGFEEMVERVVSELGVDTSKINVADFLRQPAFKEELKKALEPHPLLFYMIMDILILKNQHSILVNKNGDALPFKGACMDDYLKQIKDFKQIFLQSYISVSLSDIVSGFIKEKDMAVVCNQLALLTEEEADLISLLRSENNMKSINIRFNEQDQIDLVEITELKKVNKASRLIDLIMTKGYQDITIKTQAGDITTCENTRKIRFSKQ